MLQQDQQSGDSLPRKVEQPEKCEKERQWFSYQYLKPRGIPHNLCEENIMAAYKEMIWQQPTRQMILEYGSSIDEMAALCGEGGDGWLMSSHIEWLLSQANKQQQEALCLCLPSWPGTFACINDSIKRFVFVANIGKTKDGETFFASIGRPGCHWVLIVIDLQKSPEVIYCDSLGWNCPPNILNYLQSFVEKVGLSLTGCNVRLAHNSQGPYEHVCQATCCNYPVQRCSNVCGIVAVVMGLICALDNDRFSKFISPGHSEKMFLHDPTKYERYLRRVLICWFMTQKIKLEMLFPEIHNNTRKNIDEDHTYAKPTCKRKHTDSSSQQLENGIDLIALKTDTGMPQTIHNNRHIQSCERTSIKVMKTENNYNRKQEMSVSGKKKVICPICKVTLSCRQAFHKHKKTKHPSSLTSLQSHKGSAQCTECDNFTALTIQDLIKHMQTAHKKGIQIQTKQFSCESQFEQWKKQIEKDHATKYIKVRGTENVNSVSKVFYYCRRSGAKKTNKISSKSRRLQGSCKIGQKCTAYMIARKILKGGNVEVEYCLSHSGHSSDLAHQTLSDDLRKRIAGMLSQGIDPGRILDDIRDEIVEVNRDTLLTRKDIHNIKKQYNISKTQKHKLDGQSVDLWVQDLKKDSDNPIIFYKPQNSKHCILKDEDFLLCIQTDFQRTMMKKYANKILCADSTHNTNHYDFYLTSILILDDYEEGIPVAWAISNREDAEILEFFLESVKHSCGQDFVVDFFMSDLANNFYNAWCAVFSKPIKRLYCSWHVDKSWRKNILELIKNQLHQCNIYAFLKILQIETNENLFRKKLQQFLQYLNECSPPFYDYFKKNYVADNKVFLWAGCFRIGTLANTNMYVEAFHRVLKEVYFNKKQNRRVDYLLAVLLKLAKNKAFEQLIKLKKGKVTHRIREIRARHRDSEDVCIIEKKKEEQEWIVASTKQKDVFYSIHKIKNDPCTCKLVCDLCNVCVHMYNCTCKDFKLKAVSCKHIHAVHKSESAELCTNPDVSLVESDSIDVIKSLVTQKRPDHCQDTEALRMSTLRTVNDFVDLVMGAPDATVLQGLYRCAKNAYSIGCGLVQVKRETDQHFTQKHTFPSNKNHETQRRLFSTKKKRKKRESKLKLRKPDSESEIKINLSSQQSPVCALCFCEDDKTGSEEIKWFECCSCHCVIHLSCNLQVSDSKQMDCMKCPMCC